MHYCVAICYNFSSWWTTGQQHIAAFLTSEQKKKKRQIAAFSSIYILCPDISQFLIWIKLCSDLLTKWLSGSLTAGYKENEICWCCSDFVTHLEASQWQTLPNSLNPLCLSKYWEIPRSYQRSQCFICNEGWQLQLMDQITGPTAKSNYRCIFCTHSIQHWLKSQSQYFVWSCVLIMYNNIIEVNNQRVFCFFHSVFKDNIAVCADSKMTIDCSINNNK